MREMPAHFLLLFARSQPQLGDRGVDEVGLYLYRHLGEYVALKSYIYI